MVSCCYVCIYRVGNASGPHLFEHLLLTDRLEKETDMLLRFVVGHSKDQQQENEMNQEIAKNGAFLRLPIVVSMEAGSRILGLSSPDIVTSAEVVFVAAECTESYMKGNK